MGVHLWKQSSCHFPRSRLFAIFFWPTFNWGFFQDFYVTTCMCTTQLCRPFFSSSFMKKLKPFTYIKTLYASHCSLINSFISIYITFVSLPWFWWRHQPDVKNLRSFLIHSMRWEWHAQICSCHGRQRCKMKDYDQLCNPKIHTSLWMCGLIFSSLQNKKKLSSFFSTYLNWNWNMNYVYF